jgi:hypothetical protein
MPTFSVVLMDMTGLMVVDASIMPFVPSAPTNLTTIMIAEHVARHGLVPGSAKGIETEQEDREVIEIPLDDRDGELLPTLHEYFKSSGPIRASNRAPHSTGLSSTRRSFQEQAVESPLRGSRMLASRDSGYAWRGWGVVAEGRGAAGSIGTAYVSDERHVVTPWSEPHVSPAMRTARLVPVGVWAGF